MDRDVWDRLEDELVDFRLGFAGVEGAEAERTDRVAWVRTGLMGTFVNAVLRYRVPDARADAELPALAARFRDVPAQWIVTSRSRPTDIGARLERLGYRRRADNVGMSLAPADLKPVEPPPGASLARVTDVEGLRRMAAVVRDAFEAPEIVLDVYPRASRALLALPDRVVSLVASVDGEAAACGLVHVMRDGTAGVYDVATVHGMRGRGLGGWVTTELVREAERRGASLVVLHASPLGLPVYRRLGFRECGLLHVYERFPQA